MDPLAKFQKQAEEYEISEAKKKEQEEKKAEAEAEALEKAEKSNKVEAKIKQIKEVFKTDKKNGLKLLSDSLKKELSYNNLKSAGNITNYKTRLRNLIKETGLNISGSSNKGMSLNNSDGTIYNPDKPEGEKSFLVSRPKKIKKPSEKKPIEPQDDPYKLGPKTIKDITEKEKGGEFGTAITTKYMTEEEEKRIKRRLGKKEKEKQEEINRLKQIKERIQRGENPELSKSDKDKVKRLIEKEKKEEKEKKKDIYGLLPEEKKKEKPPRMISANVAYKVSELMKKQKERALEPDDIKNLIFLKKQAKDSYDSGVLNDEEYEHIIRDTDIMINDIKNVVKVQSLARGKLARGGYKKPKTYKLSEFIKKSEEKTQKEAKAKEEPKEEYYAKLMTPRAEEKAFIKYLETGKKPKKYIQGIRALSKEQKKELKRKEDERMKREKEQELKTWEDINKKNPFWESYKAKEEFYKENPQLRPREKKETEGPTIEEITEKPKQKEKTPPKEGMSKEGSDAIYKMLTGESRKGTEREQKEKTPPLPPLPSEAKIKRMLENKKRKEEEEDERKAEKRDIDIEELRAREKIRDMTRRQQIKKEKIKEKERMEPKSSLDIFEEDISGISRADIRDYERKQERARKTAEKIRKQEERREQPRTKRQMEHILLNQRIEDMTEYGILDPVQEFISFAQHERKEREQKNKDHIDNRKMTIKADTTNKTMAQIEEEEEQKQFNKQLEAQLWADQFLTPENYEQKHNLYGQESYNNIERKLLNNIEIYERQVVGEVIRLTKKREQAIREGKLDPDREYTIGDYNEMFNYTDEARQQRRERHMDVIEDFMRENNISSSSLQGKRLSEMGDRGLRHIAESIGIGEDSYNRYEGLLDVYEVAREMGVTGAILERPEIKETYMGRALRTLDQEGFEKGGKLTNINKKFGAILEAMTVPVKMMAGTSDLGDVRRLWEGFKGGRDIAQGVGRVIKAQPKEEKQTTTRDYEPYDDTRILEELKNIRGELVQQTGSGLKYPEQKQITPYYFPRPDQYYDSVGLIKNSITNYLNDMNIYGGSYTSDNNLNDI